MPIIIMDQQDSVDIYYCEKGLSLEIITNCNKLFVSKFWKKLHK